jgi:ubiquinone/menaquinone biosynthesis C-methylase UbiE
MQDKIQPFYNRFSYPLADLKSNSNVNGAKLFKILDREMQSKGFKGKTFLDVGCGSGHRILDVAKAFPEAKFYAFDISEKSIELARQQAAQDGVENIVFDHSNIMDYNANRSFDVIVANGVFHHLDDPADGIKNLARFLTDDGLFVTWVFHTYGEFDKMLQRRALRTLLSDKKDDFEAGVALMRDMGFSISANRYGGSYGDDLSGNDELSRDADAFLNPLVSTFTFEKAIELFGDSGLDWVSITHINFQEQGYFIALEEVARRAFWVLDVKTLLGSEMAYKYYQGLSKMDKLRVIELMAKPVGFTVVAGKESSQGLSAKRIREDYIDIKGELS